MNESREVRIVKHGKDLLRIFRKATERDPGKLCRKLRRLEAAAARIALQLCNGPEFAGGYEEVDRLTDAILAKVNALLGNMSGKRHVHIFINRDPRGYALKIRDDWMKAHNAKLERDWGGYGLLAPEIK